MKNIHLNPVPCQSPLSCATPSPSLQGVDCCRELTSDQVQYSKAYPLGKLQACQSAARGPGWTPPAGGSPRQGMSVQVQAQNLDNPESFPIDPAESVLLDTIELKCAKGEPRDSFESLQGRVDRYGKAKPYNLEMRDFLHKNGFYQKSIDLNNCGNYLTFRHYTTVDRVRLSRGSWCKQYLLCLPCAIRRGSRLIGAYVPKFEKVRAENPGLEASLMTLTVKNGPDLGERVKHLQKGLKNVNQRIRNAKRRNTTPSEFAKIKGMVGTYEVTNGENGWHPHTHAIILHYEKIDQEALAAEWKEITGDSWVVDVRPLQHPEDPAQDFVEVFKYAVKFSTMGPEKTVTAWEILQGKRLIYSQGLFWGVPEIKSLDDELLENLPYVELFYRYIPGTGYRYETRGPWNKENQGGEK